MCKKLPLAERTAILDGTVVDLLGHIISLADAMAVD